MNAAPTLLHWPALGRLLLTSLAVMGSPGPATISLVGVGVAYGPRRARAYLAGMVFGTWIAVLAVATGITAALLALPALRDVLIAAAAGYILWLAYRLATAVPLPATEPQLPPPGLAGGLLFALANVKGWIVIAATYASVRVAETATADAVAKVLALAAMVVVILTAWLLAGASLAPLLRDGRRARALNRLLAALLVVATALALVR